VRKSVPFETGILLDDPVGSFDRTSQQLKEPVDGDSH
jgi:hypothetical protein